jgi:hypothetical protein
MYILKAPGFNPGAYKVRKTGFKVCFQVQFVPLHRGGHLRPPRATRRREAHHGGTRLRGAHVRARRGRHVPLVPRAGGHQREVQQHVRQGGAGDGAARPLTPPGHNSLYRLKASWFQPLMSLASEVKTRFQILLLFQMGQLVPLHQGRAGCPRHVPRVGREEGAKPRCRLCRLRRRRHRVVR